MKVVICGAGQVGVSIAKKLSAEENNVTIVDSSVELIRKVTDSLDVNAVLGFASHPTVLEEAGTDQADMVIAVTQSDEVNMVVCQVARSFFNVPLKIARIRHQNYLHERWMDLYRQDQLPVDVIISPEREVAAAINDRLHVPGCVDAIPFANGKVKVVSVRCSVDCPLANLPMNKIYARIQATPISIMGIVRDGSFRIQLDRIIPGDEVYFATDDAHLEDAMELFGYEGREARRVIIVGGGNIGFNLAAMLEQEPDIRLKLLELDNTRAEYIAQRLQHTNVINGSGLETEILEEANITETEALVALTDNDEVNILSSLLAKRSGCQRTFSLIKRGSYTNLVTSLGVDAVVNPREITVSSILRHVRRGRIISVHSICNGEAELIEAEAVESSPVVGKTLFGAGLPREVRVGVILRNQSMLIPDDETVIKPHDRVIMLCMSNVIKEIEKIFSVKFEYF